MRNLFFSIVAAALCASCSCSDNKVNPNWLSEDDVAFAADESFQPIVADLSEQFGLLHPESSLKPFYCAEDSAFRLLLADSLQMAIVTRPLSDKEEAVLRQHSLKAQTKHIATDAFALVVNKANADTLITLDDIRGIVSGKITDWSQLSKAKRSGKLKLVFDKSGSSTVRFMKDSINGGAELKGNVYAQGSYEGVVEAVQGDANVIGVISVDRLRAKGDTVMSEFRNLPFNVMKVSRFSGDAATYVRPYQYYIATGQYPLSRKVYVITTDPRSRSMLLTFFHYLRGEKGQLIIQKQSQLMPNSSVFVKSVHRS